MKSTEPNFFKGKGPQHNLLLLLAKIRGTLSTIIALSLISMAVVPEGLPPPSMMVQPLLSFSDNAYGDHFDPDKISGSDLKWSIEDNDEEEQYDPIADLAYYYNLTQYSYILYYGQFDKSITASILSAKPTLLITNYYAMDRQTREQFAENNVTVIAYVPITWTNRDIDSTLDEIENLLDDGADGIFVDEAATMNNDWELWYHGQIYNAVKDHDEENIVVINPGTASINEKAMLVADIICFEHDWRNFADVEWALDYPGWRFMGISSNEFYKVMGYNVDKESALDDLEESRHMNIAYHYSADHYIWLPPWLDVYGGVAGSSHPVGDYSYLDLDPIDQTRPEHNHPVKVPETGEVRNESESDSTIIEEELLPPPEEEEDAKDEDTDDQDDDLAEAGEKEEEEDGQQENEPPIDPNNVDNNNDNEDEGPAEETDDEEVEEEAEEDESNDQDSDVIVDTDDSQEDSKDVNDEGEDDNTDSTEQDDEHPSDVTDTFYNNTNTATNESYDDLNANVTFTGIEPATEEEKNNNSANITTTFK